MVKCAECETIWYPVRATVRVPHDVRCIESEQAVRDAQVEVADTAAALVGTQYGLAEFGVTSRPTRECLSLAHHCRRITCQTDPFTDRVVHGFWKMVVQEYVRCRSNQFRIAPEKVVQ